MALGMSFGSILEPLRVAVGAWVELLEINSCENCSLLEHLCFRGTVQYDIRAKSGGINRESEEQ